MANIGNLVVRIAGDNAPLARSLSGAKAMMGGFASGIAGIGRAVTGVGGIIAGGGAIAAMAKAVSLAREQEQVTKKLQAVLDATGHAAGFTADELENVAGGLQDLTNFGDEAIMNTQALLATFKEIKGDQFIEATKAVLDMTAVLGGSAKTAAIQLGKALNNPIIGVGALRKAGVSFTESQKEMIKSLQESGDLMGAQKIILAELKNEFGGAAEAMADPIVQLKNSFGDLGEVIGESVLPHLRDFAKLGKENIDDMSDSLEEMNGHVDFIADLVHSASIAFKGLVVVVDALLLGIVLSAKWAAKLGSALSNSPRGRSSGLKQWFDDIIANADDEIVRLGGELNKDIDDFNEKFGSLFPSELRGLGLLDGFKDSAKEAAEAAAALKREMVNTAAELANAFKPAEDFFKDLALQIAALTGELSGLDSNEMKLAGLIDKGQIGANGVDEAKGLIGDIQALQRLINDFDLADVLSDRFRTPMEEFIKVAEDLDRLLESGALIGEAGEETARRAFAAAQGNLADSAGTTPDIFTGRAEAGSAEAIKTILRAQAGSSAVAPQEKLLIEGKKQTAHLGTLLGVVEKGVEKIDPPEVAEVPP